MSYKSGFYKGRLGIGLANNGGDGTGNPRFPLDVNGDIRLTGSLLRSDGTPYLGGGLINYIPKGIKSIVNNDGGYFVGFGTHTPTEALDISGNLKVSGQILSVDGDNFSTVVPITQQQTTTENPTWHGDVTTTVTSSSDSATALNNKADIASPTFTGNVGIGETNHDAKLEIYDNTVGSTSTLILKRDVSTYGSSDDGPVIEFKTKWINNGSVMGAAKIRSVDETNNGYNGGLAFDTNFAYSASAPDGKNDYRERMRISYDGNVGIGTTTPQSLLDIHKTLVETGLNEADGIRFTTTSGSWNWSLGYIGGYNLANNGTASGFPGGIIFKTKEANSVDDHNLTTRMVIDAAGNVGIGTTSPKTKLHVKGGHLLITEGEKTKNECGGCIQFHSVENGTDSNLWAQEQAHSLIADVKYGSGGYDDKTEMLFFKGNNGDGDYGPDRFHFVGAADFRITLGAVQYGDGFHGHEAARQYSSWANGEDASFIVKYNGNVGIGTTDPKAPLHIVDKDSIGSASEVLRLQRGESTGDINTSSKGSIGMYLEDDNAGGGEVAKIEWRHDGTNYSAEGKGTLSFWTSNTGAVDGVPEERMTIRASGNVGIGTTSPDAPLQISGQDMKEGLRITRTNTTSSGSYGPYILLHNEIWGGRSVWGNYDSNNTKFGPLSNNSLEIITNATTRMTIHHGGQIGIGGTTSCDARTLHIKNQHTNWTSTSNWNYYNAVSFPGGWTHFETVTGVSTNSNMAARAEGNFKFGNFWPKTRTGVVGTVTIGATGSNYYRKYTTLMRIGTTDNYYFMFHVYSNFVDGYGGYIGAALVVDGVDTWVFRKSSGGNEIKSRTEGYSWTAGDVHLLEFYIYFDGYGYYSKSGMGLLWTRDGYSPTNHNSQYTGRSSDNVNGVTGWDNDFNNAGGANLGYENEDENYTTKIEGDQCGGLIIESDGPSIYANNNIVCTEVTANRQGASSDDRLKHNEKIVTKGLNVINKLKLKTYFKGNVLKEKNFDYELDDEGKPITDELYNFEAGFIAQDVMNIPELKHCVIGEEYEKEVITKQKIITLDEPEIDEKGEKHFEKWIEYDDIEKTPQKLYLNYNDIFCYNVLATQELAAQQKLKNIEFENENTTLTIKITDQEDEISTLKTKNVDFKNKLTSLETENQELKTEVATLKSELAAIKTHLGI